jgi:hypothetical protein
VCVWMAWDNICHWHAGRDHPKMNATPEDKAKNDALREFNKQLAQTLILDAKL